ncbi:MAG TPA: hypothetical protein VFV03_00890 [Solirubrobacteraceae bacterium]|nr:hypothetical protein [Solirubrobacteraceae bacterium]
MIDADSQRPWSEAEITRMVSTPGSVPASLKRLRTAGLIHRWNDLVSAAQPAVRFHQLTQSGDLASAAERGQDRSVLELLIVSANDGKRLVSEEDIFEECGATDKEKRLPILDAFARLDASGLIERRGGRAIASEAARYFDHAMTL